ncbi:hypothetical protein D0860_00975 [Hortaea werneckii]|uniref:Uncharacterized protein n=1 Tax=Hortaea werneckii TaxID=91943 RepID=A0A3M7HU35_HORWE|nr:hypothetical protein D0860_00975 [Hortaea werneckii]
MKNYKSKQPARKAYVSSSFTPTPPLPTIDSTPVSDVESNPSAIWPDPNASKRAEDSNQGTDVGDTDKHTHSDDSGKSSKGDENQATSRPASRAGSWDRWLDRVLSRTPSKKSAKQRASHSHDSTASSVRSEYRSPTQSPTNSPSDSDPITSRVPRPDSHMHRIRRLHEPHQDLIIEMREAKTENPSSGSGIVVLSGTRSVGQKVRIQMPDEEKPDIVARFLGYTEGSCSPMSFPLPSEELNTILESMYFAVRWSCKGFGWAAVSAFESMVLYQDMDTLRKTVKEIVSEFGNEAPEAAAVRCCLLYGLACRGEDILSDPLCRVRLRKLTGATLAALGDFTKQRQFDASLPIYEMAQASTEFTGQEFKPRMSAAFDPFDGPEDGEARKTKTGRNRSTSVRSVSSSKS